MSGPADELDLNGAKLSTLVGNKLNERKRFFFSGASLSVTMLSSGPKGWRASDDMFSK